MKIKKLFKDKDREEKIGITDFINRIVQIFKWDLKQIKISTQEVGLIKPVEP